MVSSDQLWFEGTFACSYMRLRKRKSPGFLFPVQMAASGDGRREFISEAPSLSHKRAWETERLQGGATVCSLFLTLSCRQLGKQILL